MKKGIGFAFIFILIFGILSGVALADVPPAGISDSTATTSGLGQLSMEVLGMHILTTEEMVYSYNNYKPEIKSKELFMDLLQSLQSYSTEKVINETVPGVIAKRANLLEAMKLLRLGTKLDLKKIDYISLTRNPVDSSMRLDLFADKPFSASANYVVASINMYFPKESSWSVQTRGKAYVLKNLEGKPNVTASLLFGVFGIKIDNIRESGVFQYSPNEKDKSIFGYIVGEKGNDGETDRNFFAGANAEKLSYSSVRYKGMDKTWPEEIPIFSELKTLSFAAKGTPTAMIDSLDCTSWKPLCNMFA